MMYAPELAEESSGFNPAHFSELAPLESNNFWFRVRNRLLIWALKNHRPEFRSLLEIGCGTGYVLSGIAKHFPTAKLHGSEIFIAGLEFAAARLPATEFVQMDARQIPFCNEFEVIGAFDVLEHIEEDTQVLTEIHRALIPEGLLLLTVPQHEWMWSSVDDDACHVRRYSSRQLHEKVQAAGFDIIRSTSFVSMLLPLMYISRIVKRLLPYRADSMAASAELILPRWLNAIFEKMLSIDFWLIRTGFSLPLGGSRLLVARKAKF